MKKQLFYLLLILLNFQFVVYSQNDSLKGGELYSSNFLIDGVQRNFTYYMPANYGKKDQYALVIFLHDMGGSGKDLIKSYGNTIHAMADSSDCIIIYPDAVAGHWNDKMGGSFPATDTINDAGFISILIDYFRDVYYCDAKRVYIAGFSNGGELAYRLSCDISAKITAIAPFISNPEEAATKCNSSESVAIMNTNQTGKNPDQNDIVEAWNFFMAHTKQ
jgi:polyhydroxybutyrate depolymerase